MKLMCYAVKDYAPKIVAANPHRYWMDQFPARHAYRCLPLNIANSHGWDILCPVPIEIEWNGGPLQSDLAVRALKPLPPNLTVEHFARSAFARGIVTFHLEYIFKTERGWDMVATGPANHFKDNAQPLTGIIETDWLPYPFAMSWQIMRPGKVVFDEDEPICHIYPIKKQALVDCQPEIHDLSEDPELERQFLTYRESREEFLKRYLAGEQDAVKQGWLRHYFTGQLPDGSAAPADHISKLRLPEPVDQRASRRRAPAIAIEAPLKSEEEAAARRTDPRWADDSALNTIDTAPTARNETGRRRIDGEGRLRGRETLRIVDTQADAADLDLVVIDDFLSSAECDALARAAAEAERTGSNWEDAAEAAAISRNIARRGSQIAGLFYRVKAPLAASQPRLRKLPAGAHIPANVSAGLIQGGTPRGIAGICFLNDDYAGGELFFTALDLAVRPRRGTFVAFADGYQHELATMRIEKGAQLALTFVASFERAAVAAPPRPTPATA
jgi:hypothetical protein